MITKAPLRISFFGGGTDSPEFVAAHGPGLVLGTAIDKFVEYNGKEFTHPVPLGTGLGSSSAACVAELKYYTHDRVKPVGIARRAWELERARGSSVGWQDVAFASYGGFNLIEFHADRFIVHPVKSSRLKELQDHVLLLDLGAPRKEDIAKASLQRITCNGDTLKLIRRTAEEGYKILTGTVSMASFGSLLHVAWMLKRSLTDGISSPDIDAIYDRAISSGSFGGKVCGAGGGGFLLLIVAPELREQVKLTTGLPELPITFSVGI